MTAARSAPSGPVISPEGGGLTQGRLNNAAIAVGAPPVTCVAEPVFAGGGSFLLSAECAASSAAALTAARYDVIFTPTGGAPQTIASRLLTDITTTEQPFRLQALIKKVPSAGELKIVIDNRGSQELRVVSVDAQIQPLTITT